jgi:hypothetical protein
LGPRPGGLGITVAAAVPIFLREAVRARDRFLGPRPGPPSPWGRAPEFLPLAVPVLPSSSGPRPGGLGRSGLLQRSRYSCVEQFGLQIGSWGRAPIRHLPGAAPRGAPLLGGPGAAAGYPRGTRFRRGLVVCRNRGFRFRRTTHRCSAACGSGSHSATTASTRRVSCLWACCGCR